MKHTKEDHRGPLRSRTMKRAPYQILELSAIPFQESTSCPPNSSRQLAGLIEPSAILVAAVTIRFFPLLPDLSYLFSDSSASNGCGVE